MSLQPWKLHIYPLIIKSINNVTVGTKTSPAQNVALDIIILAMPTISAPIGNQGQTSEYMIMNKNHEPIEPRQNTTNIVVQVSASSNAFKQTVTTTYYNTTFD